jgi:hypothetical protein
MVMMPVATAALKQLPKQLIPHRAAVDNTMKMTGRQKAKESDIGR